MKLISENNHPPCFSFFFLKCPNCKTSFFSKKPEHFIFSVLQFNSFVAWKLHFSANLLFVVKKFCSALLSRAFVSVYCDIGGGKWGGVK